MTEAAITFLEIPTPGKHNRRNHGGNIAAAEARFGKPKDGWLDVSTGINPNHYPLPPMPDDVLRRLPGNAEMDNLLAVARKYYRVPDDAFVVAAPGSQALVQLVPEILTPASVSILGPTYNEHEPCWNRAGHNVVTSKSTCGQAADTTTHALVVNPNNPNGNVEQVDGLLGLAHEMHSRGGALVVDEAFGDVAPELSLCPHGATPGLIILRSFGKFFGLAGVRLGFVVCDEATAKLIQAALGPWAVSGPAMWAGTIALNDSEWVNKTRTQLNLDAKRLDKILKISGMEIIGGTSLFRLASHVDAQKIYERLGRKGILARSFDENQTWLRFGLPGNDEEFIRLESAIKD